jgi:hypothetical protein
MKRGYLVLLILAMVAEFAFARGDTSEEYALNQYQQARYPVVVSKDNQWRMNIDTERRLHRVNLQDSSIKTVVQLPTHVTRLSQRTVYHDYISISTSKDGAIAALTDGCDVSLVYFPNGRQKWMKLPRGNYCEIKAVTISPNGKRLLVLSDEVKLFDSETFQLLLNFPHSTGQKHGYPIYTFHNLAARFLDDEILLLKQGAFGEAYESESEGSQLIYSMWNITSGMLLDHFTVKHTDSLSYLDFYWDYLPESGQLWRLNQDRVDSPEITLLLTEFGHCGSTRKVLSYTPIYPWLLDWKVDPLGRWFATVESDYDLIYFDLESKPVTKLVIRRTDDGEILKIIPLSERIRSLNASQQGDKIIAASTGTLVKHGHGIKLDDGGNSYELDIKEIIKGIQPSQPGALPVHPCRLPGELTNSRNIKVVSERFSVEQERVLSPDEEWNDKIQKNITPQETRTDLNWQLGYGNSVMAFNSNGQLIFWDGVQLGNLIPQRGKNHTYTKLYPLGDGLAVLASAGQLLLLDGLNRIRYNGFDSIEVMGHQWDSQQRLLEINGYSNSSNRESDLPQRVSRIYRIKRSTK